jgi:SAM-dependent methyltransferase
MNMALDSLDAATSASRKRWDARYAEGVTPWDTGITPPEVVDFWQGTRLPHAGIALDLGCGPGTNIRYLASLGLEAIGVEIASTPLVTARKRIQQQTPALTRHATFVCADVCRLPFRNLNAAYILDIGCLHALPRAVRPYYVEGVIANLAPGGYYHLYAFDTNPNDPEPTRGAIGIDDGEIADRFSPSLQVVEEIIARPDRRPCRWYLLQRPL